VKDKISSVNDYDDFSEGLCELDVDLGDARYPVFLGHGLADEVASYLCKVSREEKILLVSDTKLEAIYGESLKKALENKGFEIAVHVMPAGKVNKTFSSVMEIFSILEEQNYSRDSCVIALGGGVIGDLAGFVASCWYRGMNLIHIPSNLISMIDSSVGGKCAINFGETVNAVGSYHHPIANFIDFNLLQSLPEREFRSGMAEIIKSAIIADRGFFEFLVDDVGLIRSREINVIRHIIERTIFIKTRHVAGDIRENGKRLFLNFGHTLGHAMEMATQSNEESLRHGEGVALGISAILEINVKYYGLDKKVLTAVRELLTKFGLPVKIDAVDYPLSRDAFIERCLNLVGRDKKRKDGNLRLVLLNDIGSAAVKECDDLRRIRFGFQSVVD
jgi:3-dehydroquinate synthase